MSHQTECVRRSSPVNIQYPLVSLGSSSKSIINSLTGPKIAFSNIGISTSPDVYKKSSESPNCEMSFHVSEVHELIRNDSLHVGKSLKQNAMLETAINDLSIKRGYSDLPEMYQYIANYSGNSLDKGLLQKKHEEFHGQEENCQMQKKGISLKDVCSINPPAFISRSMNPQQTGPPKQEKFIPVSNIELKGNTYEDSACILDFNYSDPKNISESKESFCNDVDIIRRDFTCPQYERYSFSTLSNRSESNNDYLDKNRNLVFCGNDMRRLLLNSKSKLHYLKNEFQNICVDDYGSENECLPDSLIYNRTSSLSETSVSDLLNHSRSLKNKSSTSSNNTHRNLALDEDLRQPQVKTLSDGLCYLGRFSPSLDQGYATLVSPSPTGQHNKNMTFQRVIQQPQIGPLTLINRKHPNIGSLPWNKKRHCRSGPFFDHLKDDTLMKLFSWMNSCELCNIAKVCRRFQDIVWRPILWKIINLTGDHIDGDKALKMIFRHLCGQSRNGSCLDVQRVMIADGCRISDKTLRLLTRRCPELTHLQLQTSVNISNEALFEVLLNCNNLQHLDIAGCSQLTTISPISTLDPHRRLLLQYLDISDCTSINDVGLKIIVKTCPQLLYLYLRRCIHITDAGLKFLPSFCLALKELSVSDCINITDFGIYELAKLGAGLRYLSVAKCDRVSDAGLKVIARRCYKLRYLNARGCEAVSDDSITVLARACPRLRALDIGKCDVSDAGLRALAECCPNLKKLSLRNCDMITDRGVQCIAYCCRGLQQLNIQDCQISIEGYRAVKKYCKRCIIEHTNPGFC